MKPPSSQPEDKRSYYRISGVIYLHAEVYETFQKNQAPALPEAMDAVALRLLHFKALLNYHKPSGYEQLKDITEILELMHQAYAGKTKHQTPFESRRQPVNISGSGMEFITDKEYSTDQRLSLTISFPEYPFATVKSLGKIVRVSPCGKEKESRYKIAVHFEDISESDRDLVIKFVNHLQRKRINEK